MKWKNRLTNYNFWISLVSAVLLIFQAFDLKFDIANFNEIVTAVLGLLVVIGIISDPTKTAEKTEEASSKIEEKIEENKEKEGDVQVQDEDVKIDPLMQEQAEDVVPSVAENEDRDDACKDDFQVLMSRISSDIEEVILHSDKIKQDIMCLIEDVYAEQKTEKPDEEKVEKVAEPELQQIIPAVENEQPLEEPKEVEITPVVKEETIVPEIKVEDTSTEKVEEVAEEQIEVDEPTCFNIVNN